MSQSSDKPWGGRFSTATAALMERFNASIGFDRKLMEVDISGSLVYARALEKAGILNREETDHIVRGLEQVRDEMRQDTYVFSSKLEDIHMAVESRLIEVVGAVGGKLHTGRSRNDQVNLDERLYLRQALQQTQGLVRKFQAVLVDSAQCHASVFLPGYTHLQQAQPILFSHYALSLFWMLERDYGRLQDTWKRADYLPLGSGALAGGTFALDREFMATELGFSNITPNSLDAVSDRDFLLEALSTLAILMAHLSRYCEDLIIWSAAEFGFVELDDTFSTGSSMMPQKKNPDSLELIRGKTGRVYGSLMGLLTTMKGIPLSYAKDMQEDKEPVFDAFETAQTCLEVFAGAWSSMRLNPERMAAGVDSMALATDLADYLVRKGMPFREAHHVIGRLVRWCLEEKRDLAALEVNDLQRHCEIFEADALEWLNVEHSLTLRNIDGGTGVAAVQQQLNQAKQVLQMVV